MVICFAAAVLFITGGILAIVYRENVKIAFCIVAGILLFAAGVYELIFGIRELVNQNKSKERKPVRKAKKKEPQKAKKPITINNSGKISKKKKN